MREIAGCGPTFNWILCHYQRAGVSQPGAPRGQNDYYCSVITIPRGLPPGEHPGVYLKIDPLVKQIQSYSVDGLVLIK